MLNYDKCRNRITNTIKYECIKVCHLFLYLIKVVHSSLFHLQILSFLLFNQKDLSLSWMFQLPCIIIIIIAVLAFYNRCHRVSLDYWACSSVSVSRNNANITVPPTVSTVSKKEPHENIARIAKRYLDDNMQQAWINPRLISMVSEYKCNDTTGPCIHSRPLSSARTYVGGNARALSEPTNKLVCGGLQHWGKFRD